MVEDDKFHRQALGIWANLDKALVPTVAMQELAFFLVKFKLGLDILGTVATDPKVELVPNTLDDFIYLLRHSDKAKYWCCSAMC